MDPNSSLGKISIGEEVVVILSDKVKGYRDWNSSESQDTANSGKKKETKAMVFYHTETKEVSNRIVAPCFVNRLEAYDGKINLRVEENMISNEYAVKLCFEHEVKKGNRVVKKELIVALRGEIFFVKFIINPEEDDVEPGVIFGRSFLRMTKAITDFKVGTITIYLDIDPSLEETEGEEKSNDDWDHFLNFNIDDVPLLGTSSSAGGHLTQEEAAKETIAIRMSRKVSLLEEERPIIKTMVYNEKYKKILDEVWKDKVELDGKIVKEEEDATIRTHDDEAGSSRSKHPRQHKTIEEVLLSQSHHKFLLWEGCNKDAKSRIGCDGEIDDMLRIRLREARSDEEVFTYMAWIRAFNINEQIYVELCHEFILLMNLMKLGLYQAIKLEEEGFNVYFKGGLRNDEHFNAQEYWLSISREENLGLSWSHTSTIRNPILRVIHKMIIYGLCQRTTGYDKIQKNDLWILKDVVRSLSALMYCRDLDTITLRDLIDSDGKLIPEDLQPGVPRVGIPRPSRASMQDLYDMMGKMEIHQEAIVQMEYRQSYHWDMYQGVFEHMAGVYSVPLQGAYNPPGYAQSQYDKYYQKYPPPPL
uniref:Uncharacterized protein n=1 Tax=Tanacetum cinerariifolium TaxID=118510 RepID=A0A6L2LRE8_TANCI|nr:hypothetical protein [Tanacetum cinerariifolium]